MELSGLACNDDGLCRLADFEQRLTERIEAYDATPTNMPGTSSSDSRRSANIYNLQGMRADTNNAGIYIKNGQKVVLN